MLLYVILPDVPTSSRSYLALKPQELIPYHPKYNVQDWDDPPGAIDWPRLRSFMHTVKQTGEIPDSHKSHDHLNEQKDVSLDADLARTWATRFQKLAEDREMHGERITWGLVDGFLLYWDEVRCTRAISISCEPD